MKAIWKKMGRKAYRDSYVSAHISNTVAGQIAAMREARGWTQKELAERAGMKQARVSVLEDPNTENFEARTLKRIASALDVALTIRFLPFSDLVRWADTISDEKMNVRCFDQDFLSAAETCSGNVTAIRLIDVFEENGAMADPAVSAKVPSGWLQPVLTASQGLKQLRFSQRAVQ
jgi:transcriptional regulator with XRE-family HTH domain